MTSDQGAKGKAQSASKRKNLPNRLLPLSVEILSNPFLPDWISSRVLWGVQFPPRHRQTFGKSADREGANYRGWVNGEAIGGEDSLPSLVSKGRWSSLALNKLPYSRKMPFGISGMFIDKKSWFSNNAHAYNAFPYNAYLYISYAYDAPSQPNGQHRGTRLRKLSEMPVQLPNWSFSSDCPPQSS